MWIHECTGIGALKAAAFADANGKAYAAIDRGGDGISTVNVLEHLHKPREIDLRLISLTESYHFDGVIYSEMLNNGHTMKRTS